MPTINSKQHDTTPPIVMQALDGDGNIIPLTGTVKFIAKDVLTGTLRVNSAAELLDPVNGKMRYQPVAGDVATPGTLRCEFEVTFSGGGIETFPERRGNDEIIWIIAPDLA